MDLSVRDSDYSRAACEWRYLAIQQRRLHLVTASTGPEVRCLLHASPVVRPCVPHHCGKNYWYTTDGGRRYHSLDAPLPPNTFGAVIVHFQPKSDYLIWTGNADCDCDARNCHAEAHYTTDFGRSWKRVETCAQLRVGARQGAAG